MQNFLKKLICCFKNDKILVNFDLSTRNFQNFYFNWFLSCKVYIIWPKKYRGVIFHDTKEWCKIWRINDLQFGKWHKEFGKFLTEHLKVSKFGLLWDPFIQSRKCMSLKFTEELCIMTIKNDAKFEEELTCRFKIDIRNLTNFDPSNQTFSKIFTLLDSF